MYAYTNDKLYRAILKLYMREDFRFPNLIVGMLTRESLREAFKKKIKTDQIINFLQMHAHPMVKQSSALAAQKNKLIS